MKHVKILFIAALAALAAMAVVASSASANATVCTKDTKHQGTQGCLDEAAHGKHLKVPGVITASLVPGTKAVLTVTNASGGTVRIVECSKSTASGTITTTEGHGAIESLTFSECTSSGCSNVTAKTPAAGKSNVWTSTVTTTKEGIVDTNGILHTEKASGSFTATCFFITATCEYEAATATTHITGGAPAILHANAVPLAKLAGAEAICGTKADWKATYEITTPTSLYII